MIRWLMAAVGLVFVGCGGPVDPLIVKQFTVREQVVEGGIDPMVSHESQRRLYGAVSMEERKGRLGQYYTVLWDSGEVAERGGEIEFRYLQGGSGSRVKRMERRIEGGKGSAEFAVIGDDYFENGRVLAWKIRLLAGGEEIAAKQSYLWE